MGRRGASYYRPGIWAEATRKTMRPLFAEPVTINSAGTLTNGSRSEKREICGTKYVTSDVFWLVGFKDAKRDQQTGD